MVYIVRQDGTAAPLAAFADEAAANRFVKRVGVVAGAFLSVDEMVVHTNEWEASDPVTVGNLQARHERVEAMAVV